jgi:hypothetical protein
MTKDEIFIPENLQPNAKEHISPCGNYRLVIQNYTTKEGCWNYTRGLVYTINDALLFDIKHNYHSFRFDWIYHPNGHAYLRCCEDYQGQTVLELDTGKRRDVGKGHSSYGFCWVDAKLDPASMILVVSGCVWAAPYEYRFFDFADPMTGWPQLEIESDIKDNVGDEIGYYVECDELQPKFNTDGTITCYQKELLNDDAWTDESTDEQIEALEAALQVSVTYTYKRVNDKLVCTNVWMSAKEKYRRQRNHEWNLKYEAWLDNYLKTDPLWLVLVNELESVNTPFKADSWYSSGQTYDNWCPDFKLKEKRMCRRIMESDALTLDIEIAVDTGPIKVVVYKGKAKSEAKFFMEHSADSVTKALAYCKQLIA